MFRLSLRRWMFVLGSLATVVVATELHAQRRSLNTRYAQADDFDGSFQFCRVPFSGGSWRVDFPRADINLSIRLSELTKTRVTRAPGGEPNHLVVGLGSPELFNCPFIMMTEVGSASFSEQEARQLRLYLQKGGFLWADDFWGENAWEWWAVEFNQILPSRDYQIVDIPSSHPLFRAQFVVEKAPQIASINHWYTSGGGTSERGADSAEVHTRGVFDKNGNLMVLMTHNTDFGDSFEREGDDPTYFLNFSVPGYAFGINTLLYAMTH